MPGRREGREALTIDKDVENLVAALTKPNGRIYTGWLLVHLVIWGGGVVSLLWLRGSPIAQWVISVLLGSQLHTLTVLQHDCGHRSAYESQQTNRWVGRFLAWFIYLPFTSFTGLHRWHHSSLGDAEKDPDDWFYAGGRAQLFLRECLFVPRFIYLSLTTKMLSSENRRRVVRELIFNTLSGIGVAALLLWLNAADVLLFGFILPMTFLALVYNPISRGYEHYPMSLLDEGDPLRTDLRFNTVTVTSQLVGLLWANINYHVEHHMYPRVPFYRLPTLHAFMKDKAYVKSAYPLSLVPVKKQQLLKQTGLSDEALDGNPA